MRNSFQVRFLMTVHFLISFSVPLVILSMTSCLDAEPEPVRFGPEVSADAVASALNEPFKNLDPSQIQTGEFVQLELNQSISGGPRLVTQDKGITVMERTDLGTKVSLRIAYQEVNYDSEGNSETNFFEETVEVDKPSVSSSSTSASNLNTQSIGLFAALGIQSGQVQVAETISTCQPTAHPNVTFHDLQTSQESQELPTLVQNSSFCSGSSNCSVNVYKISFDQVIWDGDSGQKVACEFVYTDETPYLSSLLKTCTTLAVPIDGRSIIVSECAEVLNFEVGN